jgi:hypothetical protein
MTNKKDDILKKLRYIDNALLELEKRIGEKTLINNKKVTIYERELINADKRSLEKAVEEYQLEEYVGDNRWLKTFSNLYREKKYKKLMKYFQFKKLANKAYRLVR